MKLEISPDRSLLFQHAALWDFKNPPMDIVEVAEAMVELMNEKNGLGLAGNQVGFPYAFFCMKGAPENFFFINPRIVNETGEKIMDIEGCLSYPGLGIKKERWHEVRLRFAAPDGQTYTKVFRGLSARVVQHEMDHLQGRAWWDGISKLKFDIAKKKAHNRGWKYIEDVTFKGV